MKTTIYRTDFSFIPVSYGTYKVTYTSPVTHKQWSTITHDMELIDAIQNADEPLKKDLQMLKRICKAG